MTHTNASIIKPDASQSDSTKHNAITSRSASCGFTGNPDLYGIGIRIGYYTQALSVWIANYFVLSESKVLRSVNLLFMFALFIGLIWLSHIPSKVYAVEAYLLSHLLVVTWSVGVFDKARFSRKYWKFKPAPIIVQRLILSGLVGYDFWFWWRGLDLMKKTPCGSFVFVVIKVNLYGWLRSLAKIASAVGVFGHLAASTGVVAELIQHKYTRPVSSVEFYSRLRDELQDMLRAGNCDEIVELASQIPLPESPQQEKLPQGVPREQSSPRLCFDDTSNDTRTKVPSFAQVLNAEAYLEDILSITTSNLQPRTFHLFSTNIKISIPSWKPQWLHLTQLRNRIPQPSILSIRPFRTWILITLFQHIYEHRSYPLYIYPKMLETALLSPHHKHITYTALKTMIAIRTVQTPDFVPPAAYLLPAINRFLTIVVLMLSIELCIRWNGISGMGNFGAVGQLVPAIIGVGGLAKVLWIWGSGGKGRVQEEDAVGRELRDCAELYYRLKDQRKEGTVRSNVAPLDV